jgi:hypothetical protein
MDYQDPGWRPTIRGIVRMLIPPWGLTTRGRLQSESSTLLEGLRLIFVAMVVSLWFFLFVLTFFDADQAGGGTQAKVNLVIVVIGALHLADLLWLRRRPLPRLRHRPLPSVDQASLLASYRGRFFIMVGIAQAPALAGVVGSFFSRSLWTPVIGVGISMIGLFIAAPSRRNIEYEQQKLNAQGSPLSLGQLLTQATQ